MLHPQNLLTGRSPVFENLINATRMIASMDVSVLILGENGTGKELIAQSIHTDSPRAAHPFITVNCAAIPDNLIESELFGYRKGSFTHAEKDYTGKIRAAGQGTLFLDEVAELSLTAQAKLLRFLETGECQVLGQQHPVTVDVRVITATNKDLRQCVKQGSFREDLYFRLHVVPLEIPALRDRAEDVPVLAEYFMRQMAGKHNVQPPLLGKQALKCLLKYDWPGNVRELRNLCERMVIFFPGVKITEENLPSEFKQQDHFVDMLSHFSIPNEGFSIVTIEKGLMSMALEKAKGNQSKAARLLGLSRDTFLYRLKKYQLL